MADRAQPPDLRPLKRRAGLLPGVALAAALTAGGCGHAGATTEFLDQVNQTLSAIAVLKKAAD